MRYFAYTYSEGKAPRDGSGIRKTVKVYRIKRNRLQHVITYTDSFVSEFQLAMMALEKAKALPRAAFVAHQFGGYKYGAAHTLRDAGFADVQAIG